MNEFTNKAMTELQTRSNSIHIDADVLEHAENFITNDGTSHSKMNVANYVDDVLRLAHNKALYC